MSDKIKSFITKFKDTDKKEWIKKHDRVIAITIISFSGMLCVGMGVMLPFVPKEVYHESIFLQITEEQVEKTKSNDIVLKEMESEVNQPISVDVKDYVDTSLLDSGVIKKLKLDTSAVNISEAGTYTFTVKYKSKTYNGIYVIKEKPLPQVDNMTLRNLQFEIGSTLPVNIEAYVVEQLSDEVKAHVELDLSKVNVHAAGNYPYTVTYNGKFYTAIITIQEKPAQEALPQQDQNQVQDQEQQVQGKVEVLS